MRLSALVGAAGGRVARRAVNLLRVKVENSTIVKTVWQKFQALCAVLCIAVYAVSTGYALFLIHREIRNHEQISEREFGDLRQFASSAASAGWTGAAFKEDIRDAVFTSQALEAVIITGAGAYAIAIEKTPGIIKWADNAPYFSGGFSFFKRLGAVSVPLDGQQSLSIHAAASYIDFASLLYILRKALLAILAAVILSFGLLIIDTTLVKKERPLKSAPPPPPSPARGGDFDDDAAFDDDAVYEEDEDAVPPPSAVDVIAEHDGADEDDDAGKDAGPFAVDVFSADESSAMPEERAPDESGGGIAEDIESEREPAPPHAGEDLAFEEPAAEEEAGGDSGDAGEEEKEEERTELSGLLAAAELYETDTFGDFDGEPDFAEALAPELEKAEEYEAGLSLLSAAWTEDAPPGILHDAAEAVFKRGSRVYEKKGRGIYIIVPGVEVDDAFETAKRFHREAVSQLAPDSPSALRIGISSRAGRTLHAERLINEAERALGKAGEDEKHPIVAFRADNEKYKAFIASHAQLR
jgi:hypothetical protein